MTESKVQNDLIKYLKQNGHYVVKTVRSNMKGVPDLLICSNEGLFYGVEVKKDKIKNKPTELQKEQIRLIKQAGGQAFVADSIEDLKEKGL